MASEPQRTFWSSRSAFLLAAIGSAVGLGNIWKFPYTAGANGGAVFIIVYVVMVFAIIAPILMAELLIGRTGRKSPIATMQTLVARLGLHKAWSGLGWIGILIAFIVLSYFNVIAGWATAFGFYSISGSFAGVTSSGSATLFDDFLANTPQMIMLSFAFMAVTVFVVSKGVNRGIEKAAIWLMPLLFALLVLLAVYGAVAGDFSEAWDFMFAFDFSNFTGETVLIALGQAFLSNSVAMGIMLTYGAYIASNDSLSTSAFLIVGADTLVALTAGLAIFPLVFEYGLTPTEGPGLIFVTLPIAFGQMPGGQYVGALFFLLLAIAALTSTISLLEPLVSYLEGRLKIRRSILAAGGGIASFGLGLLAVFSFNIWSDVFPVGWIKGFEQATFFDLIDFATTSLLLPVSGLLITGFVGWKLSSELCKQNLGMKNLTLYQTWRFAIKYLAPAALLAILGYNIALKLI